jgi:hypothetical protein
MPRKKLQNGEPTAVADPFLAKIEAWVMSVLDDPKASARTKATAATIGIKARATRHSIAGDEHEGTFFGHD